MRFLDANPFIYAFYKPTRRLGKNELKMKESSRRILNRVAGGEEVLTTVVHVSEVVNILKHGMAPRNLNHLLLELFSQENVKIVGVTEEDYLAAVERSDELGLDANDALAVLIMQKFGMEELYSFDSDFDAVEGIKRVTG